MSELDSVYLQTASDRADAEIDQYTQAAHQAVAAEQAPEAPAAPTTGRWELMTTPFSP